MQRRCRLLLAAALTLFSFGASAEEYPARPIRFMVGFPAGSSIDVVSRIVLDDIRARTNATIVVENHAGALGAPGVQLVEKADPDGYVLMPSSSATHSSGPRLLRALENLDPVGKLSHIGRLVTFDVAVVTNASGAYPDVKTLKAAAAGKPDALAYGYGSGTGQVSAAVFSQASGINARAIPYRGQPAAVSDLIGARIDFVASDLGAIMGFVQQGGLRPIAVMAEKRSSLLPDVPTTKELGIADAVITGWVGVDGPLNLPPAVAKWWAEQLQQSMASREVQEKLRRIGMDAAPLFGDAFVQYVRTEADRWGVYVKKAGIQAE